MNSEDISLTIQVKTNDVVEACIKALVEDGHLVEVVRCRECKHWDRHGITQHGTCKNWLASSYEDDFCNYGESGKHE